LAWDKTKSSKAMTMTLHCVCRALERPDPLNSEVSGNLRICLQDQI
jgi:hypothetical protein